MSVGLTISNKVFIDVDEYEHIMFVNLKEFKLQTPVSFTDTSCFSVSGVTRTSILEIIKLIFDTTLEYENVYQFVKDPAYLDRAKQVANTYKETAEMAKFFYQCLKQVYKNKSKHFYIEIN